MFRFVFKSIRPLAFAVGVGILAAAASAKPYDIVHGAPRPVTVATAKSTDAHRTNQFAGAKANAGFVTHENRGGKSYLTLSDDFKVPETPAPHWQVVDSSGNTYLLNRLVIKGDKLNKTIEIPGYVHDIAKVQIWCAFAEVNLGEASFASPVK